VLPENGSIDLRAARDALLWSNESLAGVCKQPVFWATNVRTARLPCAKPELLLWEKFGNDTVVDIPNVLGYTSYDRGRA